ncbi:unnamed protein product [Eruca vesicaria subsp. sativa]|uniref:Uncharacterized protein n=1 Tax=Eruca vesicaria subsp. sativa TaxID=29727 RepID=A0ABC8JH17_ERUVS|nr:unnamed protein product [Eruca vesicaria subsp. sativa]
MASETDEVVCVQLQTFHRGYLIQEDPKETKKNEDQLSIVSSHAFLVPVLSDCDSSDAQASQTDTDGCSSLSAIANIVISQEVANRCCEFVMKLKKHITQTAAQRLMTGGKNG